MSDPNSYGRDQRGPYSTPEGRPYGQLPPIVGPPIKQRHRVSRVVIAVVGLCTLAIIGVVSCTSLMFDGAIGAAGADKAPVVAPPKSVPGPKVPAAVKWVPLATLTGGTEKTSDTIRTTGGKIRVTWKFTKGDMVMGAIYLLDEGTDLQRDGGIPVAMIDDGSLSDSIVLRKGAGEYFVQVTAVNSKYKVTVEEQR